MIQMKKLFTSASLLALSSATALAADFPMKAPPMMAQAPLFSWTGCYIGGHVGAGALRDPTFTEGHGNGGLAGGQIGCNYQDGNAVFGLEGEGYWSGIKATTGSTFNTGEGFATDTATAKNKSDFSIAARAGIAFDRTLVYGKAGWVWGNFSYLTSDDPTCIGCSTETFAASGQLQGLLLGVGLEHAFTRNWTVKMEYNFLDFGDKQLAVTECDIPGTCFFQGAGSNHATKQIFKVGFNYLFDWGAAPVLGRY